MRRGGPRPHARPLRAVLCHLSHVPSNATEALAAAACAQVPVSMRLGEEGEGFMAVMLNFNSERLSMAVAANRMSRCCLEEVCVPPRSRPVAFERNAATVRARKPPRRNFQRSEPASANLPTPAARPSWRARTDERALARRHGGVPGAPACPALAGDRVREATAHVRQAAHQTPGEADPHTPSTPTSLAEPDAI